MKKEEQHMIEEKKSFTTWVKAHKRELIIAGVSTTAVIALIIVIRNRYEIAELWKQLQSTIGKPDDSLPTIPTEKVPVAERTTSNLIPFDISEHVRNLHDGWSASAKKIATAAEHGYELKPGQTWVEAYKKGVIAA